MKKYIYLSCMVLTAFLTTSSYAETKQSKGVVENCKISYLHVGIYQGFSCSNSEITFVIHPSDTVTFDIVKELVNTDVTVSVYYEDTCKFKRKYTMSYEDTKVGDDQSGCVQSLVVKRWKTIE
ncbi:MAG: hypothetical protein R3A45_10270 [Bdellovibrionota bacterium]